jgi:hypothetical protein
MADIVPLWPDPRNELSGATRPNRAAGVAGALAGVMLVAGVGGQAQAAEKPAARSAAGSLSEPGPIPLNKLNWSGSAGFNSRRPAWYVDGSAVVRLQGAVSQVSDAGGGADLIGTLPRAARPARTVYTIVDGLDGLDGLYADLAIQPNGDIDLISPRTPLVSDYSFVSLESVSYRR